MAKCDLSIELDNPDLLHEGDGTITGVVHVVVDADVKCNGLEVQSVWRTHGRGNVATGTAGTQTLFSGDWQANESFSYRFELPISGWPPTYHGHYLNVDHYVDVRAKIPWGFDPKNSAPFRVRPSCGAEDARVKKVEQEVNSLVAFIIGFIVLGFFFAVLVGLFVAGPFAFFFLLLPLIGFLFWFVRKFLPRWLLGEVSGEFPVDTLSPGETTEGELTIQPKKGVSINAITLLYQSREQVVSGSGSNRTTHKNVIFEQTDVLQESMTLSPGVMHRFPLRVTLPDDAAYSLDLDDNELIWSATLRVDIPRWPDWVKEIPLTVVPSGEPRSEAVMRRPHESRPAKPGAESLSVPAAASPPSRPSGTEEDGVTFSETVSYLWSARADREQVEMLVEAVLGLAFSFEARIERRLLYGGDDDPHVYKDGYAVWAHYTDPPLPMVLYVPHELADEFEQIGREIWRGRGTIVGWDGVHGRLQVKIDRP